MSAAKCYAMWRLKEGVSLKRSDVPYFSPGGFSFTHRSGETIGFDFEENRGSYKEEDKIFDFDLKEIDNDFITSGLKYNKLDKLVEEQYDINFFRGGKVDFSNSLNEIHCCLDVMVNGKLESEADFRNYVEPVYLAVFDPYSEDKDVVELYNNLTTDEYKKYFG